MTDTSFYQSCCSGQSLVEVLNELIEGKEISVEEAKRLLVSSKICLNRFVRWLIS